MLTLREISVSRGTECLLDAISLDIEDGERVCLVGRNGAGKSTLLGIVTGRVQADDGQRVLRHGLRIAELTQQLIQPHTGSVRDVVAGELAAATQWLEEHARLIQVPHGDGDATRISLLHEQIEAAGAWDLDHRIQRVCRDLGVDPSSQFTALSGGLRRRALLARALFAEPHLLVLDEPTNHLDMATIQWLQDRMLGWRGTLVFTTHDRQLLSAVATRIVELDRSKLSSWPGDFDNYLRRRDERMDTEREHNARFDARLAEEETWIRQGIKARRTRNEGRVRRLKAMRAERIARREQLNRAEFQIHHTSASGQRVIEARGVCFSFPHHVVIKNLNLSIQRGDRIGIIGNNGSGKTTLVRALLGELPPTEGEVIHGTRLEIAYFDQHRSRIDPQKTVADNVADGSEFIQLNGKSRHVLSYLQEFLFTPARARSPASILSGGERSRLLLARLFATSCNVLVMDEPTNDLDIETLELLEERLIEFNGTLLLVSHDRAFLDNVVTSVLVLPGDGRVDEFIGGFSDWQRWTKERTAKHDNEPETRQVSSAPARKTSPTRGKLGYKQQRELEALPGRIESLEDELQDVQTRLSDPSVYKDGGDDIAKLTARLNEIEHELAAAYTRWEALESATG